MVVILNTHFQIRFDILSLSVYSLLATLSKMELSVFCGNS